MEQGYKSLLVWQKSYQLTLEFFKISRSFPRDEVFGLTSQMKRSCLSVPSNIAEGYCRNSKRLYLQHISIARGSLAEFETQLLLSSDLRYLSDADFSRLNNLATEIAKMLYKLELKLTS